MRLRWSYGGACLDRPSCRFTSLLVAYCILVQARPFRSRQGLKVGCEPMYDIQYVPSLEIYHEY